MAIDWANIRKYRFSPERPEHWPTGVYGISLEGVNFSAFTSRPANSTGTARRS